MRRNNRHHSLNAFLSIAVIFLIAACSASKYVPEGETFYLGMEKIKVEDKDKTYPRHSSRAMEEVENALKKAPNGSLFGHTKLRLPFTYGFYFNEKIGNESNTFTRWLEKTLSSKPIFVSNVNPSGRSTIAQQILQEYGYFHSSVSHNLIYNKDSLQALVQYYVSQGAPHVIDSVEYDIDIVTPDSLDLFSAPISLIKKKRPFSISTLEAERDRIAGLLQNQGYYYFRPDNIVYQADTTLREKGVHLKVNLSNKADPRAYQPWYIGNISYNVYDSERSPLTDSLMLDGVLFRFNKKIPVRAGVLRSKIRFIKDKLYNASYQNRTVQSLATLNTFSFSDVNYTPSDSIPNRLNVTISSQADLPYYAELETVFKSKSNNQLGPGLSLTLNKKNLFRGGELLSMQVGTNYEWETRKSNLPGSSWDINSYGISVNSSLTFPRIMLPFLPKRFQKIPATTSFSITGGFLNRSSFYRLGQFSGRIAYNIEPQRGVRHTIIPIRVTYNSLLRTTAKFDSIISANPVLALSFQDQFIPVIGYTFGYEQIDGDSPHTFSIEASVSEAGNILSTIYALRGEPFTKQKTFINNPFAQFVKGSLEMRYAYSWNSREKLATRLFAGAIYSYGNMLVAPYTEQFYSGGANSIRAFNVRTIGPGSYRPTEYSIYNFMDRTGDIRLEGNIEYRRKLFGSLELATFIDAGNIWLMREDQSRPGGVLTGKSFFKDLALGTGLGIRYDLSYLVIRFDTGVALHAPYSTGINGYFNTFGKKIWKDAFSFHLAIGYPF